MLVLFALGGAEGSSFVFSHGKRIYDNMVSDNTTYVMLSDG
jgi:hypothetical protein